MKIKCATPGRSGGYSLVELMAVVSIAGALSALAIPGFHTLILDNRRTTAVNELMATLLLARAEAIKRGQPVVVCGVRDADGDGILDTAERTCAGRNWSSGWVVGAWSDANGDRVVDPGELEVLRAHFFDSPTVVTVTAGSFAAQPPVAPAGTAVFKPFSSRSANGTITLCDRRGATHARGIIVSGSGRSRVTARRADGLPLACP